MGCSWKWSAQNGALQEEANFPIQLLAPPSSRFPTPEGIEKSSLQSYQSRVLSVLSSCTGILSKPLLIPVSACFLCWDCLLQPPNRFVSIQCHPFGPHHYQLASLCWPVKNLSLHCGHRDLRARLLHECYVHTRCSECMYPRLCLCVCSLPTTRLLRTPSITFSPGEPLLASPPLQRQAYLPPLCVYSLCAAFLN